MHALVGTPIAIDCTQCRPGAALASFPRWLNLCAMSEPAFDRAPAAVPLDRETLLARFDGIRQFARGGRRAPNKPLLLLYALARLKHDRQTEIRFNTTEAIVSPLQMPQDVDTAD